MKNQKGFSLIELLVVVIIIGIIAAIAIPALLASRRAAVESAAISAMRVISSSEAAFQAGPGGGANYGSLADLGTAGLIDSVLAAGSKGTYGFVMTGPADGTPAPAYCVVATPAAGSAGVRVFAISSEGVIREGSGATAPTCSAAFVATGGAVLGN